MKKICISITVIVLLASCHKQADELPVNPLEGEWYFKLNNAPGFYAYNDRADPQFNVGVIKTLYKVARAGAGTYTISLKNFPGKVMDYNQVNSYTYLELLPENSNESQLFRFEKLSAPDEVYHIVSVSHPNHVLSAYPRSVGYSVFFDAIKNNSLYRQEWKLEK
jgi:hypothetical protein